jgi:hypothetical protein
MLGFRSRGILAGAQVLGLLAAEALAPNGGWPAMNKSENNNAVEIHGCIVCGKQYNILVVYTQEGRLVDCIVTSPGGHRVPDEQRPLVACDTHSAEEIEVAYKRWLSKNGKESDNSQEDG